MRPSYRFNEFLASRLSALSLENVSEAEKTLAVLSKTAKNYDDLDVNARVALLDKVNNWCILFLSIKHLQEFFIVSKKRASSFFLEL